MPKNKISLDLKDANLEGLISPQGIEEAFSAIGIPVPKHDLSVYADWLNSMQTRKKKGP